MACGLAGALSFALLYGFGLLDPGSSVWTMPHGDMAQMLAGYEALLRDPNWRFPPVVTDRLVWPLPMSIVFTDSIPWLVLALRATGLPPEAANPLAIFLLISHVLQAVASFALLRASGLRHPMPVAAGVVLALLMPAWIARQFGHVALAGHWILLLALALAVSVARVRLTAWRAAGLASLAALAAGVHVYHLVPVLGCALAAAGAEVLRGGAGAWRRAGLAIGAVAASVGLAAWLLGYGYGGVPAAQAGVLGLYAMDLLGPVLPQGSALAGQRFDGFWFTGMIVPAGGDGFEGYNYFGAGILLLLAAAGTAAIFRRRGESRAVRGGRTFWPLAIMLLALTALAVGPRVHVAATVLLDLPQPSGRPWNLLYHFRAHGRFFWLPAYALLAWALVVLDRRAPPPITAALCALAIVLQLADTAEVRRGVATRYAAPMEIPFPGDDVRAGLLQGRRWEFLPTLHCTADEQDREVIRRRRAQRWNQQLGADGAEPGHRLRGPGALGPVASGGCTGRDAASAATEPPGWRARLRGGVARAELHRGGVGPPVRRGARRPRGTTGRSDRIAGRGSGLGCVGASGHRCAGERDSRPGLVGA